MDEFICSKCGKVWKQDLICPACGAPCHPKVLIVEDADMLRELKGVLRQFDRDNIPMRQTKGKGGAGVNVNIFHRHAYRMRQVISTAEAQGSYKSDLAELVLDLWRHIEDGGDTAAFFALRERVRKLARRI